MNSKSKLKKQAGEAIVENIGDGFDEYQEPKKWYSEVSGDPRKFGPVTDQVLIELKGEAKKCWDSEVTKYYTKNSKSNSDFRWMKLATSKGTILDKVAASTILIQNNSIANLEMLRNLVAAVKVGKKNECIAIIETLSELFLSDLLRPNAKLKSFHQRPLSLLDEISSGNAITRKKYLAYWYYEDQLKEIYTEFVFALNKAAHDSVDTNKEKAIAAMHKLLVENPEQEKNLLTYIVNKFGDPSQKVASKAVYCLGQLLFRHSNMQEVVLLEVEKLLFRQNVSQKAQYYGLCFLSQFYLSHDLAHVARKLIQVYFAFFKACTKNGDVDSRMMSALLMGVNRAYPYAKLELQKISEHVDTMYRVVHVANFNIALHILSLLYQICDYQNNVNDRFYSLLYKKLLDPNIGTTTHQAMLLNLVYKALNKDTESMRVMAFIKRLLQLSLMLQPSLSCAILYLISQVLNQKPNWLLLKLHEKQHVQLSKFEDAGEERCGDIGDENIIKIQDDAKEGRNCTTNHRTIENTLTTEYDNGSNPQDADLKPNIEDLKVKKFYEHKLGGSWIHRPVTVKHEKDVQMYNPISRNPLYAGAEYSGYLELIHLQNHSHPSVALFAEKILKGEPIEYSGDPLQDFTLIRFLDRFVFKNPKKLVEVKPGVHPTFGKRKSYKPIGLKSVAVNSEKYLSQNEKNIPSDELFLFKFLQKRREVIPKKEYDENSDMESVASDEFEEMLDRMHGNKNLDDGTDYMNEIGDNLKSHKKKGDGNDDDYDYIEENIDDEEMEIMEDEDFVKDKDDGLEMNEEDDELLKDLNDDDELSDMVFDSDEDEGINNKIPRKKLKKSAKDFNSVFVPAEEFASLLEDEGSSLNAPGGSNIFANKDKADKKQVDWEEKRNHWLYGYKKAVSGKFEFKSMNKLGNRQAFKTKYGNKNKKQKFK